MGDRDSRLAQTFAPVAELVRRGEPIDRRWDDGLHLHIGYTNPVLHVYRGDERDAAASLLGGQASVLVAGVSATSGALHEMSRIVLEALTDRFGCALVVELWTAPPEEDEEDDLCLIVPRRGAPDLSMEVLERSLAHSRVNDRPWRVAMELVEAVAPEGQAPIVRPDDAAGVMSLGLRVTAGWTGPEGGIRHPKVLRDMRRGLGRALKEAGYGFARRHARIAAPHYHVLGRGDLHARVVDADREICRIGESYSVLLDVTPVNVSAARAAFHASGRSSIPEFHYRPLRLDTAALKRQLYDVDLDPVEDPALHDLLEAKRQEIDREITLLDNRCRRQFLADSIGLFGGMERDLWKLARSVLDNLAPPDGDDGPLLSPQEFCRRAEEELAWLRARDPSLPSRVRLRPDVAGLLVSQGDLLVADDLHVPDSRVEALLQHEVGTHIVTRHNGCRQPLRQLGIGMAGYEETQEGVAVLAEYLVDGLTPRRLRLLAARVIAVGAVIEDADFVEVYRLLSADHGLAPGAAFGAAMRVVRGGGLTKDAVYLRGFARVLERLASGVQLTELLVGKIALDRWTVIEELRWREILQPAHLAPRYLDDPVARARLQRAAAGLSVPQIAGEMTA